MAPKTRLAKIHEQETAYHSVVHSIDLTVRDEQARKLKVANLLLCDNVSDLQEAVAGRDSDLQTLAAQHDDARAALEAERETCRAHEKRLKQQERDAARLKAELDSLSSVSDEARSSHAEKLAMTRELDRLRPELEHLRLQLAQHQTVIADKLALERRTNELEARRQSEQQLQERLQARLDAVEAQLSASKKDSERAQREADARLEDTQQQLDEAQEKVVVLQREAKQRAWARNDKEDESEALSELRKRLSAVEAELALEKEARAQAATETAEQIKAHQSDADAKIEVLHDSVAGWRAKLKATKAELAACRAELAEASKPSKAVGVLESKSARSTVVSVTKVPLAKPAAAAAAAVTAAKKGRPPKTASDGLSNDLSLEQLHTPGNDAKLRRPLKRKGIEPSLLGEKSLFSITPFLAKSRTLGDESAVAPSPSERVQNGQSAAAAAVAVVADEPKTAELECLGGSPEGETDDEDGGMVDGREEDENEEEQQQQQPKQSREKDKKQPKIETDTNDIPIEPVNSKAADSTSKKQAKPRGRPKKTLSDLPGKKLETPSTGMGKTKSKVALEPSPTAATTTTPTPSAKQQPAPLVFPARTSTTSSTTKKHPRQALSAAPARFDVDPLDPLDLDDGGDAPKKRRKLLGHTHATIYEDADEDEIAGEPSLARLPIKAVAKQPAAKSQPPAAGKRAAGEGAGARRLGKTVLGPAASRAFSGTAFSPLKRDRRGVGASFLA